MKKAPKEIIVFILTFALGFCGVLGWYLYDSNKIVEVNAPSLLDEECERSESFPGLSKEASKVEKGGTGYFPVKIFFDKDRNDLIEGQPVDVYADNYFGKFLKAAVEKSFLDVSDKNSEIYRFTLLDSFAHPIFVRVERSSDIFILTFKELDGKGGYEPGKLFRYKAVEIKERDWCKLKELLNEADFWRKSVIKKNDGGLDGASWMIESYKHGRYHIVHRWSPEKSKYREIGEYLLKLSVEYGTVEYEL